MMITAIALLIVLLVVILYTRYFPVFGVPCKDLANGQNKHTNTIVDIRDYNVSTKNPVNGAIVIPTAYLKRFSDEIPSKEVHIVAANQLEKNVGVRYLRKKGFKVNGYTLTDCQCQ
ncbi:sulfurtransferase [Mesobacillus foraminis]|nr:sulfurtransferase [Mesobacillus foraminis]